MSEESEIRNALKNPLSQYRHTDPLFHSLDYDTSNNEYLLNIDRKAKTHNARQYKFVTAQGNDDQGHVKIPAPTSNNNNAKKQQQNKKPKEKSKGDLIKEKNNLKIWAEFKDQIKGLLTSEKPSVSVFLEIQIKILSSLIKKLNIKENQIEECLKNKCRKCELLVQSCRDELSDPLLRAEKFFNDRSCPKSGNIKLFKLLKIPHATLRPISYENQINCITEMDRELMCLPDPRCTGFQPTSLQREIMNTIDNHQSILVNSPASTGKTMLSLYLVHKTKQQNKKTVYISPNKVLCNEFSLFAYNQKCFTFVIGNEDYFEIKELENADLLICTMAVFFKVLLFTEESLFVGNIGSIIFDEFPRTYIRYEGKTAVSLLHAVTKGWQIMILSATFHPDMINLAKYLIPNLVITKGKVRPTDLLLKNENTLDIIPISSMYSQKLLKENNEETALRLPATLQQFKDEFRSKLGQEMKLHFPKEKLITGYDMTYSIYKAKAASFCQTDSSVVTKNPEIIPKIIKLHTTPEDIYQMMNRLQQKNLLPAMFLHSNKKNLTDWHQEITKYLQRDYSHVGKKKNIKPPSDLSEDEEIDMKDPLLVFGWMDDYQLSNIFKCRYDFNTADTNFRFGIRGTRVKHSEYFPGIQYGLGIHHHGVEQAVRDAVESGLRMGYIKVVLCDANFGFGINMPVKSVVIIGDGEENIIENDLDNDNKLTPHVLIQALNRVARWGLDKEGSCILMNCNEREYNCLWDEFETPEIKFPISLWINFLLLAGTDSLKQEILTWLKYDIPTWNWHTAEETLSTDCNILRSNLGLFDDRYNITFAGKVALTLFDEGDACLFAGRLFLEKNLSHLIQSKQDFLFVATHLIKKWRCVFSGLPTLTNDPSVKITEDLKILVSSVQKNMNLIPGISLPSTSELTSFYVLFPKLEPFLGNIHHPSDLKSYCAHFIEKIESFQHIANLPFGDEALRTMKINLEQFKYK